MVAGRREETRPMTMTPVPPEMKRPEPSQRTETPEDVSRGLPPMKCKGES